MEEWEICVTCWKNSCQSIYFRVSTWHTEATIKRMS
jgi:hypothetical protein